MLPTSTPFERLENGWVARNVRSAQRVAIAPTAPTATTIDGAIATAFIRPIFTRIERILKAMKQTSTPYPHSEMLP